MTRFQAIIRAATAGRFFLLAAALVLCLGTFVLKERAELWWQAAGAIAAVLILTNAIR